MRTYSYPVLLLLAILAISCAESKAPKTIMAVFAHPDDETTIGPVLAKYAGSNDVYLVIATNGIYGVTDHAGIPSGDSLVQIRMSEAECSCEKLGIHPPIFLSLQDGLGIFEGDMSMAFSQMAAMKVELTRIINELNPDVIITFGPGGDSGHPDHRLVGIITTEVLLNKEWPDDLDLYYFSWTEEQSVKYPEWNLNYADESNLTTIIPYNPEDEEKLFQSIKCYSSQFALETMEQWIEVEKQDTSDKLSFRHFTPERKRKDSF